MNRCNFQCKSSLYAQGFKCFSPSKVESDRFPTQGVRLFPKRRARPYNNISLLIEKPVQIHPSCLHSQSLSLYLSLSLSRSVLLAPSFCLVYFLIYKSNKIQASCRTWFFFFLAITLRLCGNVLFTMIERERDRDRERKIEKKKSGWCLPGDAGNKCTMGGLAEGGVCGGW